MSEVIETLSLRFQSGNEIPVERAMITRQEFKDLEQQLKTAKAEAVWSAIESLPKYKPSWHEPFVIGLKKLEVFASKLEQGDG